MKKFYNLILMLTAAFVLSSCSEETPGEAAVRYSDYLHDGDYSEFVDGLSFNTKGMSGQEIEQNKEQMVALCKEKAGKSLKMKGKLLETNIVSEKVSEDGNTAKVTLEYKYDSNLTDKQKVDLVKVDGDWMIKFRK